MTFQNTLTTFVQTFIKVRKTASDSSSFVRVTESFKSKCLFVVAPKPVVIWLRCQKHLSSAVSKSFNQQKKFKKIGRNYTTIINRRSTQLKDLFTAIEAAVFGNILLSEEAFGRTSLRRVDVLEVRQVTIKRNSTNRLQTLYREHLK